MALDAGREAARVRAYENPFWTNVRPLSSCRGPQAALNRSCRSDSVTRDWPVGLRVRAAAAETRKMALAGRAEVLVVVDVAHVAAEHHIHALG